MSVKLTQPVPAFRMDDEVLERLWRSVEAKWAAEKPSSSGLTVYERIRGTGSRTPEEHKHEYRSSDELRRTLGGAGLLREYTLYVASWGKDSRSVSFRAPGDGGAATLQVEAADAAWCREVVETVVDLLRPHTLWYAVVHRADLGTLVTALVIAAVVLFVGVATSPLLNVVAAMLYVSFSVVILCRDRLFPAADIRVRERGAQPAVPEGGKVVVLSERDSR